MTVYVDDANNPFGRMKMCHCWADTDEELLDMMRKIGVQTKWIQGHPELSFGKHKKASWVHFDICSSKRRQAIHHGAILTDKYGPVVHTNMLRMAWAIENGNDEMRDRCQEMIDRINRIRERDQPTQGALL